MVKLCIDNALLLANPLSPIPLYLFNLRKFAVNLFCNFCWKLLQQILKRNRKFKKKFNHAHSLYKSTMCSKLVFTRSNVITQGQKVQHGIIHQKKTKKVPFQVIQFLFENDNKRKNLYQVALLSTFYKGDHEGLIIQ